MSDTTNAPTEAAEGELLLTGTLENKSYHNQNIVISGTFEGKNLTITADNYEYTIVIAEGTKCTFEDCKVQMTTEHINDSIKAISFLESTQSVISGGSLNLYYGLYVRDFSTLTISGTYLSSPTGRFYLHTLGANTTLENLEVQAGALIQCEEDARDFGYGEGSFTGRHITFGAGTIIKVNGASSFLLEDCTFRKGEYSELSISRITESDGGDYTKIVRGCNLSNVKVTFCDVGDGVIDLSGNYWGEGYDTVEKVLAILPSHANIVINDVLTDDPVAPQLELNAPTLSGMTSGKGQVVFSWESEEGSTYRLLVDDKEVYSGSLSSYKLALAGGDHTYTVITTDKFGNYRVKSSSLTLDTVAGSISTTKPVAVFTVLNAEASGDGSLAWAIEQANAYKSDCRIEFAEALNGQDIDISGVLALFNDKAEFVALPGVGMNLSQSFAFTTSLTATGERAVFSTQDYTKVSIGSPIINTPISLSNVELQFTTGSSNTVTFAAETTLNDCSFSGTEVYVHGKVSATDVNFVSLTGCGLCVEDSSSLTLKDSHIYINSLNNNAVCVLSGSELLMEGGSMDVNTFFSVGGSSTATLKEVSLLSSSGSFQLRNYGTTHIEDSEIAAGALLDCMGNDTLHLEHVTLGAGSEISVTSTTSLSMNDCMFRREGEASVLEITAGQDISITNCNLANVRVLFSKSYAETIGKIDLSGNYWGEGYDTVEKVYTLLESFNTSSNTGYNKDLITIDNVLTEDPVAPRVELSAPVLGKVQGEHGNITLCWSGAEGATYSLRVDGKIVYEGANTSFTLPVGDGDHTYTVTATDKYGNYRYHTSSFSYDADKGAIPSERPLPVFTVENTNTSGVGSFAWALEHAHAYKESCRIEFANGLDGQAVALSTSLGIFNKGVILSSASGANMSISTRFTFCSDVTVKNESVTFCSSSSSSYSTVNLGSLALAEPITLKGVVIDLRAAEDDDVFIRTATTMNGGAIYGANVRAYANFTASNMEISSTSRRSDYLAVAGGCTLRLTNVAVSLFGGGGGLYVNAGAKAYITGGSLAHTVKTQVDEGAELYMSNTQLAGKNTSGYVLNSIGGKVELRDLSVAAASTITCSSNDNFTAVGVTFGAGTKITLSSTTTASFEDCGFAAGSSKSSLTINRGKDVSLSGCNLANTTITISGSSTQGKINLSGNYWGEGYDTVEKVISLIKNYNSEVVVLNSVLTKDPMSMDISLQEPVLTKAGEGQVKVTLSWTGEAGASYIVLVDGKQQYEGTDTSISLTLPDGAHNYEVRGTDALGATASAKGSFSYDATAPSLKLQNPALSAGEDGNISATLSWTGEAGATYVVLVDGKQVYTGTDTRCTVLFSEGEHDYEVTATDATGNSVTAKDSFTYTAVRLTSPVLKKASAGKMTVSLGWEAEEGSLYTLVINGSTKLRNSKNTSWKGTLKDGKYSYSVTATSPLGGVTVSQGTFTCDTVAPTLKLARPTITKTSNGQISATLKWSCSDATATTYSVSVDGKTRYSGSAKSCTVALKDGKHSYIVTARDALGNTRRLSSSFSYDATAPVVSLKTPTQRKYSTGRTQVTLAWSSERNARYILKVDGKVVYRGTGTKRVVTVSDGKHSYSVAAYDAAGNMSAARTGSFTTDATAPVLKLAKPAIVKGSTDGKASVTFAWTCTDASQLKSYTFQIKKSNAKRATSYTVSASSLRKALTLTSGSYTYSITARDAKGNVSTKSGKLTLDATAPQISFYTPTRSKSEEGLGTATLRWKSEKGATYTVKLWSADGSYSSTVTTKSTSRAFRNLADGSYRYSVTATDAAGNSRTRSSSLTIDNTSPLLSLNLPTSLSVSGSYVTGRFVWSASESCSYTLKVDSTSYKASTAKYRSLKLKAGKHTITLTAKDSAGNTTTHKLSVTVNAKNKSITVAAPSGTAQQLTWQDEDTAGLERNSAASGLYSFELESATTLSLALRGVADAEGTAGKLGTGVSLTLMKSDGKGGVSELKALSVPSSGLDRELALSAGSYYLQVSSAKSGTANYGADYMLDIECGEGEMKRQAILGGTLA